MGDSSLKQPKPLMLVVTCNSQFVARLLDIEYPISAQL